MVLGKYKNYLGLNCWSNISRSKNGKRPQIRIPIETKVHNKEEKLNKLLTKAIIR